MANNLLKTVSKQYGKLYAPAINVKKQQLANLSGSFAPSVEALNQAKTNAFRKFDTSANSRNIFFSGAPIEDRAVYIGETYTPELAKIGAAEQAQRLGLLEGLNELLINQGKDIYGRFDTLSQNTATNKLTKEQLASQARISAAQIAAMLQKANI